MFFRFVYENTGLRRFHSADLDDMRDAIVNEDDLGSAGGSMHDNSGKLVTDRKKAKRSGVVAMTDRQSSVASL